MNFKSNFPELIYVHSGVWWVLHWEFWRTMKSTREHFPEISGTHITCTSVSLDLTLFMFMYYISSCNILKWDQCFKMFQKQWFVALIFASFKTLAISVENEFPSPRIVILGKGNEKTRLANILLGRDRNEKSKCYTDFTNETCSGHFLGKGEINFNVIFF